MKDDMKKEYIKLSDSNRERILKIMRLIKDELELEEENTVVISHKSLLDIADNAFKILNYLEREKVIYQCPKDEGFTLPFSAQPIKDEVSLIVNKVKFEKMLDALTFDALFNLETIRLKGIKNIKKPETISQSKVTQAKENDKETLTKNSKECPICCKALAKIDKQSPFLFDCYICGIYELHKEARRYIESISFKEFWDKGYILSAIVREYSDMGTPIPLKSKEDVERIINSDIVPKDIQGKKDKVLLALERKYNHFEIFGSEINVLWDKDYPIGYCKNPEGLQYVLELLCQDGFIKTTSTTPPPVTGTYVIQSSGWDRLKELKGTKKTEKEAIIPVKFSTPPNTRWEDITIQFKDGHNVNIKIKDKSTHFDYKAMGFENKKRHLPNQQWIFLKLLAQRKGELSWADSDANVLLKKKKQLLSQTLKDFFQIDEDPFLLYKQEKAYKVKFNLIPE